MNPIDVDRHGYDEACDWLYEVNHVVFDALTVLADALSGSGGMAGNDRTGTAWATGYDEAAGQLCDAAGQLCAAIDKAANLTNTSLSNHQAADGASIYAEHAPAGVLVEGPDPAHYGESIEFGAPSALGDNGGGPGWWHWIAGHTKGWLWPNADTDELRRIGSAWRRAGQVVQGADTYTTSAADALGTQRSPEIAIATDALGDLGRHCDAIGAAMIDLGSACHDYATMVDEHHHEIEEQLASFIKWSIGLQIAGGIASIFTVGLGEGGAQAGEAAMVARAGSKAASILSDLFTMVTGSDLALTITGRLEKAVPALGKFLKAGEQTADLETAAVEVEESSQLTSTRQLLEDSENGAGHTLSRHVGLSDDALRARKIKVASTFTDQSSAELGISRVLQSQRSRLEAWLRSGSPDDLVLNGDAGKTIGRTLARGDSAPKLTSHLRVVMRREPAMPGGYYIHTSYPTP